VVVPALADVSAFAQAVFAEVDALWEDIEADLYVDKLVSSVSTTFNNAINDAYSLFEYV
jgi:hypothetical protein